MFLRTRRLLSWNITKAIWRRPANVMRTPCNWIPRASSRITISLRSRWPSRASPERLADGEQPANRHQVESCICPAYDRLAVFLGCVTAISRRRRCWGCRRFRSSRRMLDIAQMSANILMEMGKNQSAVQALTWRRSWRKRRKKPRRSSIWREERLRLTWTRSG